jgi:ribosome-binding protein aMBF1 (putative translation factor)
MKAEKCEKCGNDLCLPMKMVVNGRLMTVCFHCCLKQMRKNRIPIPV